MRINHGIDQRAHEAFECCGCVLNERGFDRAVDLLDMALMKSGEDDSLVGKVLIDGANAYPGNFGDAVRRYSISSLSFEDADHSFEDGIDGLTRAELLWLSAMRHIGTSAHCG